MEARATQLVHLRRLSEELTKGGLAAELVSNGAKPYLKVANAQTLTLNERVLCQQNDHDSWCFWWPCQQPIGSVDDLALVVSRIALVLRSVEADG